MIKAKGTALAVVGMLLAGLGGSVTISPVPALSQDRETQCFNVVQPALDHQLTALAIVDELDVSEVKPVMACRVLKEQEAIMAADAQTLAVCQGLALPADDQAILEEMLGDLKLTRQELGELRQEVCALAG
jgi:hypothetical protein